MFVFDVWADHRDRRQAIFTETEGGLKATFIDNSHLFGGPGRRHCGRPKRLSAAEVVALSVAVSEEHLQSWISALQRELPAALDQTSRLLPEEWRKVHFEDRNFNETFRDRLDDLEQLVYSAIELTSEFAPPFRVHYSCIVADDQAAADLTFL